MLLNAAQRLLHPARAAAAAACSQLGGGAQRQVVAAFASAGPTTATPPPDAARGATADLCDVHIIESVDVIAIRKVQIMEPIFR